MSRDLLRNFYIIRNMRIIHTPHFFGNIFRQTRNQNVSCLCKIELTIGLSTFFHVLMDISHMVLICYYVWSTIKCIYIIVIFHVASHTQHYCLWSFCCLHKFSYAHPLLEYSRMFFLILKPPMPTGRKQMAKTNSC